MSYSLDGAKVQLVTINARLQGQTIINRLYYNFSGPLPDPDPEVSAFWLQSFRTAFRAQVLASFYSGYTVFSYEMKELDNAVQIGATVPSRWKPVFNVAKKDVLLGVGADIGALAPGGAAVLPAHEAMRIYLRPLNRVIGFWKSNYLRTSGGFTDALLTIGTPEQWSAGARATYDAAWGGFIATPIYGVAAPVSVGWFPCAWSVNYFGRIIKPAGGPVRDASSAFIQATTNAYVGTQVTRRWNPNGTFRGR